MKLTLVVSPNANTKSIYMLHAPGCADIAKAMKRDDSASATDFEASSLDEIIRLASQNLYGTDDSLRRGDVKIVACAKEVR